MMKKAAKMLLKENSVFELGAGLFGPIYAIYVTQIGGSILDAGLAWAVFLIFIGLTELVVAKYLDRFKMKNVLIVTTLLSAAAIMSYVFVSNMYQLLVLQAVLGIISAVDKPTWSAWYSTFSKKEERGRAFALAGFTNNVGKGVAALIGAAIAQYLGFGILFIISGLLILSSLVFLLRIKS